MSDDAAPAAAQVKTPKRKTASKPKAPAAHPQYKVMVANAVSALKERGGSSRQAILKYIMANYKVGNNPTAVNSHLKLALKGGVKAGTLKQSKGTGAAGSFRLGEKKVEKKPKKKVAKKPKSPKKAAKPKKAAGAKKAKSPKKAKAPKKAATKKPAVKKAKSPKKAAKPKVAKPKAAKKPAAKKAKTPKKAAAKK